MNFGPIDDVNHGSTAPPVARQLTFANARKDLEAWIAVRESAWRGNQWVELPITELTSVEKAIHKELICRYGHDPIADREKLLETTYVRGGVLWDLLGWL